MGSGDIVHPPAGLVAVVLNWKDRYRTERCCESLVESGVSDILVVDNETSGELTAIERPGLRVIECAENLGFSAGINVGLEAARAKGAQYILVINNDAVVEREFWKSMNQALAGYTESKPDIFAPKVQRTDGTVEETVATINPWTLGVSSFVGDNAEGSPSPYVYVSWACVLLPSSTVARIGLLDESFFMYWEDVEYSRRLREGGGSIRYVSDAVIQHEVSASHERAGGVVLAYSSYGAFRLGQRIGGAYRIGAAALFIGRTLKRVVAGDWSSIAWNAAGLLWYWSSRDSEQPAYSVVGKRNLLCTLGEKLQKSRPLGDGAAEKSHIHGGDT